MTLEQLTTKTYQKLKDKSIQDQSFAIQVNLTGRIGGVFYIAVRDGQLSVMPYEYIDRDAAISISMTAFDQFICRRLDLKQAYTDGKVKIDGDVDKVLDLVRLVCA